MASLQNLGNGRYRVNGVRINPVTGRYIVSETSVLRASATPSEHRRPDADGTHAARSR